MSTETDLAADSGRPAPGPFDPTAGRQATATQWASEHAKVIADPGPLGLCGFALTTFLLSLVKAGVIPADTEPVVFSVALAYGGVAQLLAGMWEFRKGNTFGATAFASYGAFWISYWGLSVFYAGKLNSADAATAVGWFLIGWGIFTTIMLVGSLRTTSALVLVFLLLAIAYYLLGFAELNASTGLTKAGGWFAMATAGVAWYTAMAGVLASTFGRPVLPNPPLNLNRP